MLLEMNSLEPSKSKDRKIIQNFECIINYATLHWAKKERVGSSDSIDFMVRMRSRFTATASK